MTYRGPDDAGCYVEHGAGWGSAACRSSTSRGGHQPIANEDGRSGSSSTAKSTTTSNCAQELGLAGIGSEPNRHRSDRSPLTRSTATIASNASTGCSRSRSGTRRTEELFLARDRVGEKPLYYHDRRRHLLFASEIKSLLQYTAFGRSRISRPWTSSCATGTPRRLARSSRASYGFPRDTSRPGNAARSR